jgi:hypothetical protein
MPLSLETTDATTEHQRDNWSGDFAIMANKAQPTNGRVRIQFDLSEPASKELDRLVERVGAATRAEVLRRSLALYATCTDASQRGAEFVMREGNGSQSRLIIL